MVESRLSVEAVAEHARTLTGSDRRCLENADPRVRMGSLRQSPIGEFVLTDHTASVGADHPLEKLE